MIDRRALVLVGAFAAGDISRHLPDTVAGLVCTFCVAWLVGHFGSELLNRWRWDGIDEGDEGDDPPDTTGDNHAS